MIAWLRLIEVFLQLGSVVIRKNISQLQLASVNTRILIIWIIYLSVSPCGRYETAWNGLCLSYNLKDDKTAVHFITCIVRILYIRKKSFRLLFNILWRLLTDHFHVKEHRSTINLCSKSDDKRIYTTPSNADVILVNNNLFNFLTTWSQKWSINLDIFLSGLFRSISLNRNNFSSFRQFELT